MSGSSTSRTGPKGWKPSSASAGTQGRTTARDPADRYASAGDLVNFYIKTGGGSGQQGPLYVDDIFLEDGGFTVYPEGTQQ